MAVEGEVCIPSFSKDGRPHIKADALTILRHHIDFCKELFSDSISYVKSFYEQAENQHVTHRIYNPATCVIFRNEEDFKKMRYPKNNYHYIEVDQSDIKSKYHIMLTCDEMNGSNDESIECYNSVYQILLLRESKTKGIIGILKPEDNEVFSINDNQELKYRKYVSQLVGYEKEMMISMLDADSFKCFPMLSKVEYINLNEICMGEKIINLNGFCI